VHFDFTTVRLFAAVAEEGNIARAARRENIVASAVSKRIQDFESAAGVELLRRHRNGVALTTAGSAFYVHCRQILAQLERASAELNQYANAVRGQLKIAVTLSTTLKSLPGELERFMQAHPHIAVDILERPSGDVVRMVRDGSAHLGIYATNVAAGDLETHPYGVDDLCVMLREDHPLAPRGQVSFRETLEYRHVCLNSASPLQQLLADQAAEMGREIDVALTVTSFDAVRTLVGAGFGLAILPEICIRPYEGALPIVGLRLSDQWSRRELRLCVREGSTYLPARLFIDQIAAAHRRGGASPRAMAALP
jgi:DNA-binding transcriptional LysR family regulator